MFNETRLPRVRHDNLNLVSVRNSPITGRSTPHLYDAQSALESRVQVQESVTLELLEKLSAIKKEMLEQLTYAKRIENRSALQEQRLNEELQGLVKIVSLLKEDVQSFESDVKDKWKTVNAAAVAFKQLENEQLSSLNDMRSRITRSDQAISTLAQRLTQQSEEVRMLAENHRRNFEDLQNKSKLMEHQNVQSLAEMDRTNQKLQSQINKIQESLHNQVMELERRLLNQQADIHKELCNVTTICQTERNRIEKSFSELLNSLSRQIEQRLNELQKEIEDDSTKIELNARLDDIENDMVTFKDQVTRTFKVVESRLDKLSEMHETQRASMDSIREEIRQGFSTTHDAIVNIKSLLEDKLKATEENLQLEMAQLRNMVILT